MVPILPPRKPGDPPPRVTDKTFAYSLVFITLALLAGTIVYALLR